MSDEQTTQEVGREGKSAIAKMLLGKVLQHKVFSDKFLYWILLGLAFLLPIFFVPGQFAAPEFAKMMLLEVGVLLATLLYALSRLRDGYVHIPKSLLLLVSALIALQFVASAIASPSPMLSFIGSGYDLGTVNSFIMLFLLLYFGSVVFTDRDKILTLYASFLLSGTVVMVYHLFRHLFGPDFLSFGIFTSAILSPVGKWNDFSALAGGVLLIVLCTQYFFPTNKTLRVPAFILALLSLFFLVIIDFTILWFILFVITGLIVAYAIYEGERAHKHAKREAEGSGVAHAHKPVHKRIAGHLPPFVTVVLVISFIYGSGISGLVWGAGQRSIAGTIGNWFHVSPYTEVVLTPYMTKEIVSGTLKTSPLFGTGPNRFSSSFLKYKTSDINQTQFWDSVFDWGVGRIPTYFGTLGLIGMALWLAFVVLLFMKSRKVFALLGKDRIVGYLAFSLFILVLYFWSLAFFYLPNVSLFALGFLFTGAFLAFLVHEGVLSQYRLSFNDGSRSSVIITPVIVIVLVGVVSTGVLLYRQVASLVAYRNAQIAISSNDLSLAKSELTSAAELSGRDIFYRGLSNIALLQLQSLPGSSLPQDQVANLANQYIGESRDNAERAVLLDPTNSENYLQLGGVYDTLGALGIQNTADLARKNYDQALLLNPKSPRILFVLARTEFSAGNRVKAKEFLYRALAERPNYLEAISFIVQLELQDNNPGSAVAVLRSGVALEPTNFLLRFALGYLYYGTGAWNDALTEFESAVYLNPVYADAKYFLGLTYAQLGRRDDAIAQFTGVATLNPDNKDVQTIIRNLKAGRAPFDRGFTPPAQAVDEALSGLNKGKGGQ